MRWLLFIIRHNRCLLATQYFESIRSVMDGTADAPITIKGPKSAIIRASVGDAILIQHDHIHLQGFSVDGAG